MRVLSISILFFSLQIATATLALADNNCTISTFDETVSIKAAIDGDTILLKDGRFVRLIGINTPEINSKSPPAEPYAKEAKNALALLLSNVKQIGLVYGKDKRDRYQRVLAHAFLPNGINIQAELLRKGMAQHIMIPPNDNFFKCYQVAKQHAQGSKKGLWTHRYFRARPADELTLRQIGFFRVFGTVKEIKKRKDTYWLVINERFSFRIDKKDIKYFKNIRPETLRTHTVEASGWIFPYKSGLNMRIRHPKTMKILN